MENRNSFEMFKQLCVDMYGIGLDIMGLVEEDEKSINKELAAEKIKTLSGAALDTGKKLLVCYLHLAKEEPGKAPEFFEMMKAARTSVYDVMGLLEAQAKSRVLESFVQNVRVAHAELEKPDKEDLN